MWQLNKPVQFDSPRGRIPALNDRTAVLLRRGQAAAEITGRFGGSMNYCGNAGYFDIYLWQDQPITHLRQNRER
jgi:hypothetical protein